MNLKETFQKYMKGGKENKIKNLIVIFLIGLVFVITASFFKGSGGGKVAGTLNTNKKTHTNTSEETAVDKDYEQVIKNDLTGILSNLEGVGRVEVMVTFESGEESVPAINSNDSSSASEDKTNDHTTTNTQGSSSKEIVVTNDQPLIVRKNKPKVCGACIVAEGAEESITQLRITKAVTDLLNVPLSKVNVYPMKK